MVYTFMEPLSFRQFLEVKEKEKDDPLSNPLSLMGKELGIPPEAWDKQTFVAADVRPNKKSAWNLVPITIKRVTSDDGEMRGAKLSFLDKLKGNTVTRGHRKRGDKWQDVSKRGKLGDKHIWTPADIIAKLTTQGMEAGGGMGGPPPGMGM